MSEMYSFKVNVGTEEEPKFKVVSIKAPSRQVMDKGEIFYSKQWTKALDEGLLPVAAIQRKMMNASGVLSDAQFDSFRTLVEKAAKEELRLAELVSKTEKTEDEKAEFERVSGDFVKTKYALAEYEATQSDIFNMSAESYARNRCVMFHVFAATFIRDEEEGSQEKPFFAGKNYDEQEASFYAACDADDKLSKEVIKRATQAITFWYLGGSSKKEDVEAYVARLDAKSA